MSFSHILVLEETTDRYVWLSQQQTVLTMIFFWKEQHRKKGAGLQWESRKERADRTGYMGRECVGDKGQGQTY